MGNIAKELKVFECHQFPTITLEKLIVCDNEFDLTNIVSAAILTLSLTGRGGLVYPVDTPNQLPSAQGLYDPRNEHDACGLGFVVKINGQPSHDIVLKGLQILENLVH